MILMVQCSMIVSELQRRRSCSSRYNEREFEAYKAFPENLQRFHSLILLNTINISDVTWSRQSVSVKAYRSVLKRPNMPAVSDIITLELMAHCFLLSGRLCT
jgi:hypothetical protein